MMGVLLGVMLWLTVVAAWLTHIIVAIQASAWVFMLVGAIIWPVSVAHGMAVWLGYSWI